MTKQRSAADQIRDLERDEAVVRFLTSYAFLICFACVGLALLVLLWRYT